MAEISKEMAIKHLANIARHYLESFKENETACIEEWCSPTAKVKLHELQEEYERTSTRISYLETLALERNNDHDTAAEPDTAAAAATGTAAAADAAAAAAITAAAAAAAKSAADAAASAAVAAAAAAAHFVRYDGTGADAKA